MTTLLARGASWRYKEGTVGHDSGFEAPAFDDSAWPSAPAPFGSPWAISPLGPEYTWATDWTDGTELTLRAHITVPAGTTATVLRWYVDYSGTLYLDGMEVDSLAASDGNIRTVDVGVLSAGDHVIAIRAFGDVTGHNLVWLTAALYGADAWDVYASNDLLGAPIATLENAKGRYIRSELNGPGEGGYVINRHAAEATEDIHAEGNMVKVRIADCGTDYIDGFFLGPDGDYTLLSPRGGKGKEDLTFRGPGPLSYLDRARMTPCAFSVDTTVDTWTEQWQTTVVPHPSGTAWISSDPDYVYVGSQRSRRIYKVRIADQVVVGVSPVLWSGSTHWLGGLAADPSDDGVVIALETPWIAGSSANTKVHTIDISGGITSASVASTIDLGSAITHSAIKSDGTDLFLSRYSTSAAAHSVYRRNKTTGAVIDSGTVTFNGTVQTKASGISVNGTDVALWFSGTKRALLSTTTAPRTVTGSISTRTISSFGGDWFTSGGNQYFAMVSPDAGTTWLYQVTANVPQCADASGVFHPEQTSPGALAWRVIVEITHPDRTVHECPELSYDFTEAADSNGTPWPARTSTEEFTWRVGDRAFSDVLARLIPAGVVFDLDVNTMMLHAYIDADFGTDRTSGTFASGKVRFEEGVNLGVNGDFTKRDNRGVPATYITVAGDNGVYGSASLAGRYERSAFMQVSGVTTEAVLDAIGADELARQRLVAEAAGFETLWGDAELAGKYIPFKHYRKGDFARVDMDPGEFAYVEADLRVYGTLISERDGGWRAALDLGSAYKVPPPITEVGGAAGASGSTDGGGGASSGGTPAATPPLYVIDPISGDIIPNVTVLKHDGAYSPTPGTAVLPRGSTDTPLAEELLTDETDPAKYLRPDGLGGVEWALLSLQWFNIRTYGAVCDGVTDDTAAWQAAIDAATAAGGGVIYHPGGVSIVAGGLLDTSAFNGQVLLPNVSHAGDHIVLVFKGALRPGFHPVYGDTVPLGAGLSVLKSTLTGASGTAACISGGNDLGAPSGGHGNNLEVYIDDLVCLGPDNPTFTFWNLSACQGGGIGALQISTPGAFAGSPSQPTHSNAYGIKLPQQYFANTIDVGTLSVGGFYTGVLDGELTMYRNLILGPLIRGIELATTFYPSIALRIQATSVQRVIVGTGFHPFDCLNYVAEHSTSPSWAVTVYDLDDASNYVYGFIRWFNAATGGTPDHTFTVNGGSNAGNQEMGSTWGGSALTVKDEGSPLATAATSIDFVGSGVTATGSGAAKTVTIPSRTLATVFDGTYWLPLVDGNGNAIMVEV